MARIVSKRAPRYVAIFEFAIGIPRKFYSTRLEFVMYSTTPVWEDGVGISARS